MPARKSEVKVIIEAYGKRFILNCEEIPFDQFRIKRGRSLSKIMPYGTATDITEEIRKFIVKQRKEQSNEYTKTYP